MAFSIRGLLGLDTSSFNKSLDDANRQAQKFTESVGKGIAERLSAAFTGGAIVAGVMKLDDLIKGLQERAKSIRIGVSETGLDPQAYQRFAKTLEATGSSGESGAKALEHLAEGVMKIRNGEAGSEDLAKDFAALGVSLSDIKKKDYKSLFFDIADAMKSASLSAERLTAIKSVLGKSGLEMLPAMKVGFNSSAANRGVLDDEDLAKLNQLTMIAKESAAPWKAFGDEVVLTFAKIKSGLLGLPGTIKDYFTYDGGGSGAGTNAMQDRVNQANQLKAQQQIALQAASERAKKEEQIRQNFAARQDQLQAAIGQERYSLLNAKDKLYVLQKQAEVLREMRSGLEAGIRSGDPTGQTAAQLAEVKLMLLKNRGAQNALTQNPDVPRFAPDHPHNINSLQSMGALIQGTSASAAPIISSMDRLNSSVKQLDSSVKKAAQATGGTGGGTPRSLVSDGALDDSGVSFG
jgi:hypothetical protein